MPAAIMSDSYICWYKGRDRGPRSGPENIGHAPWGISEGPVRGETQRAYAVRHETVIKRSFLMTVGIKGKPLA